MRRHVRNATLREEGILSDNGVNQKKMAVSEPILHHEFNVLDLGQYKAYIFKSTEYENVIYIISIIDYLQLYNFRKYLENVFKSNFLPGYSSGTISSVPPKQYSERFINFIRRSSRMLSIPSSRKESNLSTELKKSFNEKSFNDII